MLSNSASKPSQEKFDIISNVPKEIWLKIFLNTTPLEHARLAQVCNLFRELADDNLQWDQFLKSPISRTGENNSKSIFYNNPSAIDPSYRIFHPVFKADLYRNIREFVEANRPIEINYQPLIIYWVARAIQGHQDSSDDLERLWTAQDTLITTREYISKGRGNIRTDVEKSNGDSLIRTRSMQKLYGGLLTAFFKTVDSDLQNCYQEKLKYFTDEEVNQAFNRGAEEVVSACWPTNFLYKLKTGYTFNNPIIVGWANYVAEAACAIFSQASNSSGLAALALHIHAEGIKDNERIRLYKDGGSDHSWVEVRNLDHTGEDKNIVIDAWGNPWNEGVAVFKEDYELRGTMEASRIEYSKPFILDASKDVFNVFRKLNGSKDVLKYFEAQMQAERSKIIDFNGLFNPTPSILPKEFYAKAREIFTPPLLSGFKFNAEEEEFLTDFFNTPVAVSDHLQPLTPPGNVAPSATFFAPSSRSNDKPQSNPDSSFGLR